MGKVQNDNFKQCVTAIIQKRMDCMLSHYDTTSNSWETLIAIPFFFNNIQRAISENMVCCCHKLTYPAVSQSPLVVATKPSLPQNSTDLSSQWVCNCYRNSLLWFSLYPEKPQWMWPASALLLEN